MVNLGSCTSFAILDCYDGDGRVVSIPRLGRVMLVWVVSFQGVASPSPCSSKDHEQLRSKTIPNAKDLPSLKSRHWITSVWIIIVKGDCRGSYKFAL